MNEIGKRYIGLDVHKHYLIALGVNQELEIVMPARSTLLSLVRTAFRSRTPTVRNGTSSHEPVIDRAALGASSARLKTSCLHGSG